MKTRNSLVSNSSTTSFTCCICGEVEAYSDCESMSDMGGVQCTKNHEMHESCKNKYRVKPEDSEVSDDDIDNGYSLNREDCPVCQLKVLPEQYELYFLRLEHKVTNQETLEEIKKIYGIYDKFIMAVKKGSRLQK